MISAKALIDNKVDTTADGFENISQIGGLRVWWHYRKSNPGDFGSSMCEKSEATEIHFRASSKSGFKQYHGSINI